MLLRTIAILIAALLAIGISTPWSLASAEDLVQIYRDAVASDPVLGSAKATWEATQELVPQARSALLPLVNLQGNVNEQDFYEKLHSDPTVIFREKISSVRLHRISQPTALSPAEYDRLERGERSGRAG